MGLRPGSLDRALWHTHYEQHDQQADRLALSLGVVLYDTVEWPGPRRLRILLVKSFISLATMRSGPMDAASAAPAPALVVAHDMAHDMAPNTMLVATEVGCLRIQGHHYALKTVGAGQVG